MESLVGICFDIRPKNARKWGVRLRQLRSHELCCLYWPPQLVCLYGPWFQRWDKQPRKNMYFGDHLTSVLSISLFRQRTMPTIMCLSNKSSEENAYRWFNLPCNTRILTKELLNDHINLEATRGIQKFSQRLAYQTTVNQSLYIFFYKWFSFQSYQNL